MKIDEAGKDDQKNEEGAQKNRNLVLGLKEESRQGNCDVLTAARPVWVAILLEVLRGCLICQNLQSKGESVNNDFVLVMRLTL